MGIVSGLARPALKGTVSVKQPDGTTVTIRLHGDEFCHYNTTDDGYSIVKNDKGFYVYAQKQNGTLVPTQLVAHDAKERTADELTFLGTTQKHLMPDMSMEKLDMKKRLQGNRARSLGKSKAGRYDYDSFKGLVILVEYNDCQFKYSDYQELMNGMINEENYTGNSKTNVPVFRNIGVYTPIPCTGSMRDYFRDNSMGLFNPTFDIVGPVTVDRSQYYPNGSTNTNANQRDNENAKRTMQLMVDAVTAADPYVNFKDYDVDNDGTVDMVYFIFAGLPSYIQGNDERLLWPHQSDMGYSIYVNIPVPRKDGVKLGRYACSTELFGYDNIEFLEGIGTMCHEFSHVLGLPDFYDADYEGSGGQSINPGTWSVMANGADFNFGRTPCAYSLFERYALGFATPQVISQPGSFTLDNLSESNAGYRLNTPVNKEFFMIENRQKTKWDAKLPGHGMLIFRVDSTNAQIWQSNAVNNYPNHNYYELLRAGGYQNGDSSSDPFPGSGRVTTISNETSPANLKTWAGKEASIGLTNITEHNGQISFEAYDMTILSALTLPENAVVAVGSTIQLTATPTPGTAVYTLTWSSDNEGVATVSQDGVVTGIAEGTAVITATSNNNVTGACVVTVRNMPVIPDIASFVQTEENAEGILQLSNAQVLYVKGQDIYLRDASGSIVLSNTGLSVKKNDVLNGTVYGKRSVKNRMPQLAGVSGLTNANGLDITAGTAVEPITLHVSQLTPEYYANMVLVEKAKLVKDGGVWATFGDKRMRLFNTLGVTKISVPTDMTKRYNITAIFGTNTLNGEVIDELYLLKTPTAATFTEATAISLTESLEMDIADTEQLHATVMPADADAMLAWTSSDEGVVTVSQDGLLTAVAMGDAIVTVTDLESGLQAECVVSVVDMELITGISSLHNAPSGGAAYYDQNGHRQEAVACYDQNGRRQEAVICYDLNGRRLEVVPSRGVFFIRQNGRYMKVVK